jgi:hypothetical protein
MIDDIRDMLRSHEAILVHFNTPATKHAIGYPDDLHDAFANPEWTMCYSTIMPGDRGPWAVEKPEDAAALGTVGILVDLHPATSIERVHHGDAGSNGRDSNEAFGALATLASCEASIIDRQKGHNEWLVARVAPVGIFLFPESTVFAHAAGGEVSRRWPRIIGDFPEQRIFSKLNGVWQEFDRKQEAWQPRTYDEIIAPRRAEP